MISVAFVYFVAKIIQTLYLTKGVGGMCPHCGGAYLKTSTPRLVDLPFRLLRFVAYRCLICDARFHRTRIPVEHAEQPEKSAVVIQ
jgi:hypothetical protein